jgi:HEAT repeat protein
MSNKPRRADTQPYWASAVIATSKRKADDPRASDTRSTAEIIAAYLKGQRDDDATNSLATVHYRGGPQEFRAGMELLDSALPLERSVGADVLAQLGWEDKTFLEESVDALLRALRDPEDSVVQSAIFALGHRESPRAIEPIMAFVSHTSADLRYAAVHGLMPHDTPLVVEALAKLSRDADRDVRDWATFALGSQLQSDSSTLRAALHDRVKDIDPEVRGEALVGLARRRDGSIADAVQRELEGEFHGDWAVEAARHLSDPRFLPALRLLAERLTGRDAVYFRGTVHDAVAACEGRRAEESGTIQ